ncbi:MAG: TatD family hydrolase [Deinococcota bacterium]
MIDTHCHLDRCDDTQLVIQTALDEDKPLTAMITIGIDPASCERAVALAEQYSQVYAAVGIHPTNAAMASDADTRARIASLATHPKVVAIGETGFDYYWDKATPAEQRASFQWQAELAARVDKPIILHVRDKQGQDAASSETATRIQEVGWSKGILHCFNGHVGLLDAGLELGFMVSFAGNVTYKSAKDIQARAITVPTDRILVETDSPYLAPVPKRGKPNQPNHIWYTAEFVADLRGESLNELEQYTDANAKRIYTLPD